MLEQQKRTNDLKPLENIRVKKKLDDMTTFDEKSIYIKRNMEKAWKTYEYWKRKSQILHTGQWTKADEIELQDIILDKENG